LAKRPIDPDDEALEEELEDELDVEPEDELAPELELPELELPELELPELEALAPPPEPELPLLESPLLVEPPVLPLLPAPPLGAQPMTAAARARTTERSRSRNMECFSLANALVRLQHRCHFLPTPLPPKSRERRRTAASSPITFGSPRSWTARDPVPAPLRLRPPLPRCFGGRVTATSATPPKKRRRWARAPATTEDEVRVVGAPRLPLRDVYHGFLRARWPFALGVIVAFYLTLNALFALAYLRVGGVHGARPGAFSDAFYFSVQTMGTIGYGAMYPETHPANVLVVMESVTGLVVTAVATGLVFAKFSLSTSRIVFAKHAVIGPMDGVPTLMFRLGNERSNRIIEATVRVAMVRTERTREGMTFYRMSDLPLTRERSPALSRSWTAMHSITTESPLHGKTPASLKAEEVELFVTVSGVDDTSLQPVHARHKYTDEAIVWGARHADVLSEEEGGILLLDLGKFHELTPTERTPDFPYPD
jgi:inward rectifier potassium channel